MLVRRPTPRSADPPAAFARGERLKRGEGAPLDTPRAPVLCPSQDGTLVTCLWESSFACADVQGVRRRDRSGTPSVNLCYAVEASAAFAETASRARRATTRGRRVSVSDRRSVEP